jgi:hypothetical protein
MTPTERAQNAFFTAGYNYTDAITLGTMWHETDTSQVKADAGQKLLDGQSLPIPPSAPSGSGNPTAQSGSAPSATDAAYGAYFAAGYTYDDAVSLGKLWHETDIGQIKVEAGQKLLAGQKLPIAP